MKKIKGKGIFLERSEFKIHRNSELGWDFWDPDFQVVLRSAGDCAHFFPQAIRPDGKDGGVLFSLGEGKSERLARSRKLLRKRLPKHEVDRFIKALETLRETVCTDPVKQRTYDMIRLPDPAVQPDRFRIYGPFWNRHLAILWGYDSMDKNGRPLANMTLQEGLERLKRASDPYYGIKVAVQILFRLLVLAVICAGLAYGGYLLKGYYDAYAQAKANIPRCTICKDVLVNGLCPNICVNCALHDTATMNHGLGRGKGMDCSYCGSIIRINRRGNLRVAPIGVIHIGEFLAVTALNPGTLSSPDWPTIHLDKGEKKYYSWKEPGNYYVFWQPDNPGADRHPTRIPVYVRKSRGSAYALDFGASFLLERTTDASGTVAEVKIVDCSYDDRYKSNGLNVFIRWGNNGPFLPYDDQTSRKTAQQFRAVESENGRHVELKIVTSDGQESSMERLIDANFDFLYPDMSEEKALLSPETVIVGETVLCKNPVNAFGTAQLLSADFGGPHGHKSVKPPFTYLAAAYPRAGNYDIKITDEACISKYLTATVVVKDLKNIENRVLDLSPPRVQMGNEVVATDVSGIANVVRREIRWGVDNEFMRVREREAVQSFGHPGIFEVTMRVWTGDGRYVEETRNVKVVDDDWQAIMSVEPNPVYPGQSVVVRDMSVTPPGFNVVERQIRWYPSLEFNPMPGDRMHRVFEEPGKYKAVIRMLDQNWEYHYGQAGLTVEDNSCAVPIMRVSSNRICPGQVVLFSDVSSNAPFCEVVKREFRKDGVDRFMPLQKSEFLIEYSEPGIYHPELKIVCKHGKIRSNELEVVVSDEVSTEDNNDFEVVQLEQRQPPGTQELEVSFAIRKKDGSKLDLESFNVTYFTVGGRIAKSIDGERYTFDVAPGCQNEIVTEVTYIRKDGIRGACQIYHKPIEIVLRILQGDVK